MFLLFLVLKSDDSNGVFSLGLSPLSSTEGSVIGVTVVRSTSTIGVVVVTWSITDTVDGSLASDDFVDTTGNVTFNDGITEQVSDSLVSWVYMYVYYFSL